MDGLNARGVQAVLLEHRSSRVDKAEWRCALQPALPVRTAPEDYARYGSKIRKFLSAFAGLPRSAPFTLEDPADIDHYATVIIGSDEVWNLKHPWYGREPLFFGRGLRADQIASYAASFGNCSVPTGETTTWGDQLRRLKFISVRDYNSQQLVRKMIGCDAPIVLDPCLQFPEVVRAASTDAPDLEPFIAVYGHSFPCWFQDNVRQWARDTRRRLISIGYRNDWADEQRIEIGPEEFPPLLAASDAVATNFFHGCVLSIVNQRSFACCLSDYRSNKIADLAQLVGAGANIMTETSAHSEYQRALGLPLAASVFRNIDCIRQGSERYLDNVLH